MTAPHPLRAHLTSQGRSVVWLAAQLGCQPQWLHARMSGRRPGHGRRGPQPWQPAPVVVVRVAQDLGISHTQLAEWLALETR